MPRKKTPLLMVGDIADRFGMTRLVYEHLERLRVRGYTDATIRGREKSLRPFLRWCDDRSLGRANEVTRPMLERYQEHLFHYRKKNGLPLSLRSQRMLLEAVQGFFRNLARANVLLVNPASEIELPRTPHRLPAVILSAKEVELVLIQPNVTEPLGLRDRAILETFYSTGMRRSELTQLKTAGLDMERGTVFIREGKGRRDRVVPIGERALGWVHRYLDDIRPRWAPDPDDGFLFLNQNGHPIDVGYLTHLVRWYVEHAALGKRGSCHMFRHSMATLMVENGADIRFVQAMLGHAKLETTAIYTQVSIGKLKEIHTATHPAERRTATRKVAGTPATPDLASGEQEGYDGDDEQRTEERGSRPRGPAPRR